MYAHDFLKRLTVHHYFIACLLIALIWTGINAWLIVPVSLGAADGTSFALLNEWAVKIGTNHFDQIARLWKSLQVNIYATLFVTAFCLYAVPWLAKSEEGNRFDHLSVVAFLWAFATLVHQGHMGYMVALADDTPMTLAAVWVLFHPNCLRGFVILLIIQFASFTLQMPNVSNHTVFLWIAIISVLLCLARLQLHEKSNPVSRTHMYSDIAKVLRVELILLYIIATVAKINWTYMDPDLSSCVALLDLLRERIDIFPDSIYTRFAVIYGSLLAELSLPAFLLFSRTRKFGLLFGWTFHLFLGIAGYGDFSSVVFLFYSLFTPNDFPARLNSVYKEFPTFRKITLWIKFPVIERKLITALMVGFLILAFVGQLNRMGIAGSSNSIQIITKEITFILWLGFSFFFALSYYLAMRVGDYHPQRYSFAKMLRPVFIIGPLLMVLNSITPYVGLKTEFSFTMFSDLLTEGDEWNSIFGSTGFLVGTY